MRNFRILVKVIRFVSHLLQTHYIHCNLHCLQTQATTHLCLESKLNNQQIKAQSNSQCKDFYVLFSLLRLSLRSYLCLYFDFRPSFRFMIVQCAMRSFINPVSFPTIQSSTDQIKTTCSPKNCLVKYLLNRLMQRIPIRAGRARLSKSDFHCVGKMFSQQKIA